ncbi:hypothetical protein BKA64DRAFT_139631 [Cadophora sp. MPI-SDFR-AT-0126]|nr:hypothetical protein BKA64DRAFT_139631 [Leotiomycetes sp. MPI-SDFR-AT-0126]
MCYGLCRPFKTLTTTLVSWSQASPNALVTAYSNCYLVIYCTKFLLVGTLILCTLAMLRITLSEANLGVYVSKCPMEVIPVSELKAKSRPQRECGCAILINKSPSNNVTWLFGLVVRFSLRDFPEFVTQTCERSRVRTPEESVYFLGQFIALLQECCWQDWICLLNLSLRG